MTARSYTAHADGDTIFANHVNELQTGITGLSVITAKGDLVVGGTAGTEARQAIGSDTQVLTADSTQPTGVKWAAAAIVGAKIGVSVVLGDGTNVLTSSEPFVLVRVPCACTIVGSYLDADASGSVALGLAKASAGSPTSFSSIVASAPPTLSSAQSGSDTTLTGWTTSLTEGDWLKWTVTGTPATIKRLAHALALTRSL